MHRLTRVLTPLVLFLLLAASQAVAQEPPGVTRSPEGIEFDFQEADFRVVASALAEVAGLNVIFGTIPARRVTLRTARPITEAEVRGYLESLVATNGFAMVEEEGLIRIIPDTARPTATPARATPQLPPGALRLFTYRLRHGDADVMARTLSALFGVADYSGFTDELPPSLTDQLRQQRVPPYPAEGVVDPRAPRTPQPREGLAVGLQAPVHIVPDARTNSLLIRATEADYRTIQAAIGELDVRPLQVIIEVLVAEVRRDRQIGLGIDINVPDQTISGTSTTIGGTLIGRAAGDVAVTLTGVGGIDAEVVLRALATAADVSILARPVLLTENNQEARILVGTQRPFIQLFRSLPTDEAVRDQIVQYRDVGTQLTIRPTINPDGYVSLVVLQEVSNATAETQFGAPVISTREARTRLLVRNGQTAVIGGLIDQQREVTTSGIPLLKDIPLIGWLFRSTQVRRGTTELFLFITPHVLVDDAELDDATGQIQRRPRLQEPLERAPPVIDPRVFLAPPLLPDTVGVRPHVPPQPR
jgi:type II secretory pathway component GspD/PulD (secretin)